MVGKPPLRLDGATILQVIPALETGGAERTTLEVARAVIAAGGRSVVVSSGGPMVAALVQQGSTHVSLPVASKSPATIWANKGRLIELARREGVSLVHARSRAPAWSALWAARGLKVPFVTTYHGIYNAKTAPKRLYNSAMARGDRVIANSDFTATAVKDAYGAAGFFDASKLVVIPRGADLSRFDPDLITEDRRRAAREALGGGDGLNILLPGRMTRWKGQAIAVEAARLLQGKQTVSGLQLTFVGAAQGRDSYAAEIASAIQESGLQAQIKIQGHWDDMPAAFDWADVTISASTRPEAFGRVAVEAMAMGCPVIATAHGGSMETVVPAETGLLVPPGDAEALAGAILEMASYDSARLKQMGAAGRERVSRFFSTETMTAATISVYSKLINGGAPVAPVKRVGE